MNSWPATYKHHKLLVLFTQIQLRHKGLGSGRQWPLPENFSILNLKMATSGAFWTQFVYSLFHLLDNLSILVIQSTMERASSDFGRCLKQRPKSEEARSIACLRALKSGEARASVPQWHRRPCARDTVGFARRSRPFRDS